MEPLGGCVDPLGGMDPQCGHFSVKMYANTKELGPVVGGVPMIYHKKVKEKLDTNIISSYLNVSYHTACI